ncbi:short-chain dehydrogenase/reductase SDR [Rickenella mellea]|uniref:Short-chain dehydrogenase/reductase SDR n=1 Tax=Rickenella mellea TaxID=50990 RepID=A0A4Y7Q3L2_9AGAM|nr:short-chain dehydrogenase/reductase SDR [Rickenella mellea]
MTAQGQVAVITGASAGIGRVTAIALSAHGWKLCLVARRHDALVETAKLCSGPPPHLAVGDVTDERFVLRVFEETVNAFDRVDMVFNNAGIGAPQIPMEELSLEAFQRVINVNLVGPFLFTREAFKVFKKQSPPGGRIINNGSVSAHTPRPNTSPYTSSKHALMGLTKSTALDGRAHNITWNAYTEMVKDSLAVGALQPNGSVVAEATFDPKHVADAIVHIASLPNTVTVLEINIMATGMPFVGRG